MRLDIWLHQKGHFESRAAAARAVREGKVRVDAKCITKTSFDVTEQHSVSVETDLHKFVSRSGFKLCAALQRFGVDVAGRVCLDVGISTGGFTDCLLQSGADKVFGIDVGHGQLHAKLLGDPRVVLREGVNARTLTCEQVYGEQSSTERKANLCVMDVSFISATLVLPATKSVLQDSAEWVVLVKPQFEVGPARVGKNGIVSERDVRAQAVFRVVQVAAAEGLQMMGLMSSPLKGGDGNQEYLVHFVRTSQTSVPFDEDFIAFLKTFPEE